MPITRVVRAWEDPEKSIAEACEALRAGLLVVLPTETVYGLAAIYKYSKSVERVFTAKNRPPEPLTVHFSRIEDVENLVTEPSTLYRVWKRLWPGPLTLILPASSDVPRVVTQGRPCIGLRAPAHPLTSRVLDVVGPVVMPSANVSGRPSPASGREAILEMFGRADLIIDAGECVGGLESTVVDLCSSPPRIVRLGLLLPEEIASVIGRSVEISREAIKSSRRKYAISSRVVLVEGSPERVDYVDRVIEIARSFSERFRVCILCRDSHADYYREKGLEAVGFGESSVEVAKNLYRVLRLAESRGCDVVVSECLPEEGLGKVVNARLRSAAQQVIRIA